MANGHNATTRPINEEFKTYTVEAGSDLVN